MPSFNSCVTSLSLKDKVSTDELKGIAAQYQADGMKPAAAMLRAVEDQLQLAQMEEQKIVQTVRAAYEAQGGKPKPKPKAKVKAEPKAAEVPKPAPVVAPAPTPEAKPEPAVEPDDSLRASTNKSSGSVPPIQVYHGTPHKFDKFTTAHMSAGQGVQAYGWGLYLTDTKEIGEHYRKTLSGSEEGGHLYVAEIPAEDGQYLLWDEPLSRQPEKVRTALERHFAKDGDMAFLKAVQAYDAGDTKAMKNAGFGLFSYPGAAGALYQRIADLYSDKKASMFLKNLGLAGIKYKDGENRASGTGGHNYVMFDENDVKITKPNNLRPSIPTDQLTIEVDGKRRPIENSRGQLVGQDFAAQQAFWKWFGDSKAVDERGRPIVMYHGTSGDFSEFDLSLAGSNNDPGMWGKGFYFSDRPSMSNGYGDTLMPVFLRLKNPFIVRRGASGLPKELKPVSDVEGAARLRKSLIELGHDGVIHYESGDTPNKIGQMVAFHPEQIKSATGNSTFDPNNPDITASTTKTATSAMDQTIADLVKAGTSVNAVLGVIASQSANPDYRALAEALRAQQLKTSIEFGRPKGTYASGVDSAMATASYSAAKDAAYLHQVGSAESNILHELVHASTLKALAKGGNAARQIKELYRHVAALPNFKDEYGITNAEEFIAEAYTSPRFRQMLADTPAPGSNLSIWQKLVGIVRIILGKPAVEDSVLARVMQAGPGLMAENNGSVATDEKMAASVAGSPPGWNNLRTAGQQAQADLVAEFGTPTFSHVGWWDKSVGTQYHKAAKNPLFKKVFDLAVKRENAVSLTAVRPAELAPGFLPRVDDFKGTVRTLVRGRKAGTQADLASTALLEGTLAGATVMDGVVWTDTDLRRRGMTPEGIALYRQARAAINASLDEVAAAEAYSLASSYVPKTMRDQLLADPRQAQALLVAAVDKRIGLDTLHWNAVQQSGAAPEVVDRARLKLQNAMDARDKINELFDLGDKLKGAGYTPLMRFGKYFVTVEQVDPATGKTVIDPATGKPATVYFSRFETEGEASDAYFRQQVAHRSRDDVSVKSGPVNDEKFKLFEGISPETLELFGAVVGAKEATQQFYQNAISERSALKRRLERSGTAGYSADIPRVLANFITSNGRFAAQRYYTRDINNAIKYIPRSHGDVQKEAQRLKEYIDNPGNAGAIASALAFTWFLGGNVAAALINATQPVMMTHPYLSQWGAARAATAITKAAPYALGKKEITDLALKDALKRAGREGKVDAQEIFHLYSVGIQGVAKVLAGKLTKLPLVGNKVKGAAESTRARINALGTLWGMPFAMVEGFNRRLTFIAAWDVAQQAGQADLYQFAVDAVDQTQGIYSKINRPNWARSAGGRVLFTFAQFKIMNVELIKRMWTYGGPEGKKAAAMYLAVLILAAGIEGIPYMSDIDDLIDTVGQWLGYNTNMKRTKREWAYKTLGTGFGDLALHGGSTHLPFDVGGRMGLGNMFPATGLAKISGEGNRTQDFLELGGPAIGGLGRQVYEAYDDAAIGDTGKAALGLMPTAIKNAAAGIDMLATGKAKDMRGRDKAEVSKVEAVGKVAGFNPTTVAQKNRTNLPIQQDLALQRVTEASIADQWAQGVARNDQKAIAKAQQRLADWNSKNPETPIAISAKQIQSKAKAILTPASARLVKGAPKEMRQRVAAGLDMEDD